MIISIIIFLNKHLFHSYSNSSPRGLNTVISTVRNNQVIKVIKNFSFTFFIVPFCKIADADKQTVFSTWLKNNFSDLNFNISLFEMHTKGSGFTLKLIIIILVFSLILFLINVKSTKFLFSDSKKFFFNPFILWSLAWLIDIFILLIRKILFDDKYLDLQFIFVPSILVWIFLRIFFLKKNINKDLNTEFLNDWINYQLQFKPAKFFFEKISKNKDINKSKLFYLSIQIFFLDCSICTIRILIYGCLILGRLDFTISFILFIMMIYIYKKKLKK